MGMFVIRGDSLRNSERAYYALGFITVFQVINQAFMIISTKYMMSIMGGSQFLLMISIGLVITTPGIFF